MATDKETKAIGGWLLMYSFATLLLAMDQMYTLLVQIIRIPQLATMETHWWWIYTLLSLAGFALLMLSLIRIWRGNAKAQLWSIAAVWFLVCEQIITESWIVVGVFTAWAVVWTIYFQRSKRVKKTFSKEGV